MIHQGEKLYGVHGDLRRLLQAAAKHREILVIWGVRGHDDQEKAFLAGTSKEHWPDSCHNVCDARPLATAFDLGPYPYTEAPELYHQIAGIVLWVAEDIGIKIRWGGCWRDDGTFRNKKGDLNDLGHFELGSA